MSSVLSLAARDPSEIASSIEATLAYQHPALISKLKQKLGITHEEAEQLFDDTKKFLCLCAMSEETISPNEVLDFGWHEFILFMRDYESFCKKHFGHIIYHRPRHPDDPPTKGKGGRRALALAREVFGDKLSANWRYPRLEATSDSPCDACGCNAACSDD